MKIFCDTSVLVAACIEQHPHFSRARPILASVASGVNEGFISAHSLAETYSALTTIPVEPRITPAEARQIILRNIDPHFTAIQLRPTIYTNALATCAERGLAGGVVYDALLIECARTTNCRRIYTFNIRDFHRLAPDLADRIVAP